MAKVEKGHFDKDIAYLQGMEDFSNILKAIYELSPEERKEKFGTALVATIMDRFDCTQIKEKMTPKKECRMYHVIRGIKSTIGKKIVVAESIKMKYIPTLDMIEEFLAVHSDADFAVVEQIFVRE